MDSPVSERFQQAMEYHDSGRKEEACAIANDIIEEGGTPEEQMWCSHMLIHDLQQKVNERDLVPGRPEYEELKRLMRIMFHSYDEAAPEWREGFERLPGLDLIGGRRMLAAMEQDQSLANHSAREYERSTTAEQRYGDAKKGFAKSIGAWLLIAGVGGVGLVLCTGVCSS